MKATALPLDDDFALDHVADAGSEDHARVFGVGPQEASDSLWNTGMYRYRTDNSFPNRIDTGMTRKFLYNSNT